MRRFDQFVFVVIVAMMVMTAWASAGPSTSVTQPRPPQTGLTAELGGVPTVTIDKNALRAALGDPDVRTKLREVALQASSRAGVAKPIKMHAAAVTDHQAAESLLSGDNINDHSPVFVIKMTGGRFTAMHHPSGVAAPQGNVLTVTVDAGTYRVTDLGIVDVEPDLSKLAPTTVDLDAP